ncbi:Transcription factor [Coemansia sp. RSA 2052]|nr:Transcription factor [Coemansia sp. RSA 2052]
MVWGAESLRSGPLSPAMLGGPAANSGTPKSLLTLAMGASSLRMGGLSDPVMHTGLTPYYMGEVQPTVAATAGAFGPIRMPPNLVTPGIQAEMHAVINGQDITSTPGGTLHIAPPRHNHQLPPPPPPPPPPIPESRQLSPGTTTTQLLPPRTPQPTSPLTPATNSAPRLPPPQAKRARQTTRSGETSSASPAITTKRSRKRNKGNDYDNAKISRESSLSPMLPKADTNEYNSDLEGGNDLDPYTTHGPDGRPLTEDEKRKQFLERNRIAALKCRQRKKKQLQELQDRHDHMVRENEQLRKDYMELREVAMQARAILVAHSDCSVARANGVCGMDSLPPRLPAPSLHSLIPVNSSEAEYAKKIIDAIPPASNGVPVHSVLAMTGDGRKSSINRTQRNSSSSVVPYEQHYDPSQMWRD